ncbi:MAG: hypothetical protein WBF34_17510 [Streptosporangiaceae bacterium]
MYDMYPWDNPADSASAETRNSGPRSVLPGPRHVSAAESPAAIRAVQVALDRRDNGGDAMAAAGRPATPLTAGRTRQ